MAGLGDSRMKVTDSVTLEYAELHCLSCFSFLRGASHPEELVQRASELGYRALALTDECSVAGVVRAWEACRDTGLQLIVGSEFRLQDERVVLLAQNRRGYAQLCALITQARRRAPKGHYRIEWADFGSQPDCLLLYRPGDDMDQAAQRGHELSGRFPGRCWLLIERLLGAEDAARYARQQRLAEGLMLPMVCASGVLMHLPARQRLQDVLTSIRLGVPVSQAGFALQGNAERHLRSLNKLQRLYTPDMMRETLRIAQSCRFDLGELRYEYPAELVPRGKSAGQWLAQRVQEGAALRFPAGMPAAIARQVEHELTLIAELQYEHYFLTIEDIVRFARAQGILCQGRGSAANSVVCYCLHITEVDPRQVNMLFERFISRERDEPPDIDVDFEHERREEVIQYIYRRYGRERAGIAATVIRYRRRSALRDVGKALGLDAAYLSGLCSRLDQRAEFPQWLEQLRACGGDAPGPQFQMLLALVEEIIGFPRHLSQHVGGFVISAGPLSELVPVENAAMKDRSLIQWNKDDLESLGLLKVDVLALGMLSAVRKTLALLSERDGRVLRMQDIPREDPAVYAMLSRAQSVGVFQVESRAQMNMLPRLKPRCYYDLVIQVAIVRPGPIQGDMVHPYLKRRAGLEPVNYPGDAVRQVLERTLGVPIFQEQVISLAMVAAGFTAGEADQLRRAMAAWRRSGTIAVYQQKLVAGMLARGYSEEFAQRICRQIEGFGEYGFPESHAASFALLVYVSAWLKCHEPAAFCCGLLNSQPMGFYSPAQLVQDARRQGVTVRGVDLNDSAWDAALEPDGALRLGFRMVKRLSRRAAELVLEARKAGRFSSVADARGRIKLDSGSWDLLAAGGALNMLAQHRYQARWELLAEDPLLALGDARVADSGSVRLRAPQEQADLEEDFRHLGLTLGRHPVALLREEGKLKSCLNAEQLEHCRPGQLVRVAGIVTNRQRPGSASGVTFVTLEDETGQVNLVVWSNTAQAQRRALLGAQLLRVVGVLEREGEVIHVVAGRLEDITGCWQTLPLRSRDFH